MKISDAVFYHLVDFIHDNYGINLSKKRILVEGRLSSAASAAGYDDLDEYVESVLMYDQQDAVTTMVNRLTTNHTFFMREPDHFEFMKRVFLPYIEKNVRDHDLRIWSAACSSGAEPYSMAMVIDEYFGERKKEWDTTILATDIDTDALRSGKRAVYTPDMLNTCPQNYVDEYFEPLPDGTYKVIDRIRDQVVFRRFNLMDKITYKKPFDLICCRNVMIYFDTETKDALVERFYECTKPGGFLFVGHAENVSRSTRYNYVKPAVFRK